MLASPRLGWSCLLLLLVACGDDSPATPTSTTGSTGGSTGTTPTTSGPADGSTSDSGPSTSGGTDEPDTTADTGFEPPIPECGNGYVEADEECDDGNAVDDDACSNACLVPCGLQWSTLALGPTQESEIEGLFLTRDDADQVVLSGRIREITVDMEGVFTVGDDTVLVQSYDPTGGFTWEQVLGSAAGHVRPGGVAVDPAAGDVYVGTTVPGGDGGTAIRVYKLAAADGSELWTHDFDGAFVGEDETAFDLAVGPDGQPVISGQARAGDGDDDIWLRKLEAADGLEVWTSTYSGVGSGGFSTDDGGPMAIGPDGSIFVLARIYEDFQTLRGTLLRFDSDGSGPTWTFTPTIPGADQVFSVDAVAADEQGGAALVVERNDADLNGWLFRLDANGQEVWSRTHEDFAVPRLGEDWRFEGLAFEGGELVVLGRYVNDQTVPDTQWWEAWVARISAADATVRCQVTQDATDDGVVKPSLIPYTTTVASDGSALATGIQSGEEVSLWLGSFRP